jgi:cardiolipin synthase
VATDAVPWWISVPVIIREPLMFVAVPILALLGASRIDVTWVGKAGTFALMSAFPALLYGASDAPGADALRIAGSVVGGLGVVLSYYATALYVPLALGAIREARSSR